MPLTVRKATVADAATLAGLRWRATRPDENGHSGPDHAFVEFFASWVTDHLPTHLPFLAEVDGEPVGMAWLMVAERVPAPTQPRRRCGDVQSVYVVPERRNGGIGAALLETVLIEAKELELEHVTVHANDRAVPLYLRAGFHHDPLWLSSNMPGLT